jgi:TRAP-type C4-dicarboxylate transport system permease small subunit
VRPLLRALDRVLGTSLAVLMAVMVLNVLWQVCTRFILRTPSSFTEEVARYLMIWVGLLGAAYATGRKGHLALDLLTSRLQGGARRTSECFIHVVVLAFAALVMVGGGGRLVWVQLTLGQKSAALQLNIGLVYLAVPLAGAAIVLYSLGALLDLRRGDYATAGQASSGLN